MIKRKYVLTESNKTDESGADESKRKKILETAENLKADFISKQRELIEIARKLALLKWGYEEHYSEKKIISTRTEPPIFLLVQAEDTSPLYDVYSASDGKFHLEIYKAFEMQKQGHIRILPDEEQEEKVTRLKDIPEERIFREYTFKPLPEILDELKNISFNRVYQPNENDDEFFSIGTYLLISWSHEVRTGTLKKNLTSC